MALAATPRLSTFRPPAIAVLAGMLALVPLGVALGTGGSQFASTGLVYVPLILLTGLLQIPNSRAARILSWIWFWLLIVTSAAIAAMLSTDVGLLATQPTLLRDPALAMGTIVALGMVLAATPGWYVVGRASGALVQRGYHPHAQGIVGLLILTAVGLAPLALRGGVAPLVALLEQVEGPPSEIEQLLLQVYPLAWTVLFVFWAAGWPSRVSLAGAFERLALGPLRRGDVLPLALVTLVAVGIGMGVGTLSQMALHALGVPVTDESLIPKLVTVVRNPFGALVVALCAGSTEELLVRGLLQPRFGWVLPNLGFAAAHAFQYGLDGLLVVFAVGALLAFVRIRWNTTAAIAVHASYDAVLLLLAIVTG